VVRWYQQMPSSTYLLEGFHSQINGKVKIIHLKEYGETHVLGYAPLGPGDIYPVHQSTDQRVLN
jgi:hypothetical protein